MYKKIIGTVSALLLVAVAAHAQQDSTHRADSTSVTRPATPGATTATPAAPGATTPGTTYPTATPTVPTPGAPAIPTPGVPATPPITTPPSGAVMPANPTTPGTAGAPTH